MFINKRAKASIVVTNPPRCRNKKQKKLLPSASRFSKFERETRRDSTTIWIFQHVNATRSRTISRIVLKSISRIRRRIVSRSANDRFTDHHGDMAILTIRGNEKCRRIRPPNYYGAAVNFLTNNNASTRRYGVNTNEMAVASANSTYGERWNGGRHMSATTAVRRISNNVNFPIHSERLN